MAKREQHRQGVVYGPVRPQGGRNRGAIVGSLLGVLVIVGTVGVLGVGLLTFLEGRPAPPATSTTGASPGPTPGDSAGAPGSPASSLSPTIAPATFTPTSTPSAEPSPLVTPAPTPFVPDVNEGPGYITFGTSSNNQLRVTDPKTVFNLGERMVWSANLTDRADSADLRIEILKLDPESPEGVRLLRVDEVRPRATDVQTFLRRARVRNLAEGPGLYTIRYMRGDELMSEGTFLVPEEET